MYNKQQNVHNKWPGPICPKIRKKILQNSEWANTCYVSPAGKGVFEVNDRDYHYTVNIYDKHCDCRRWNLTGIPCSHAISCLRHERIPAEDIIPQYYTTETYSAVYGFNVMPCADKTNWMKMDGPKIEPPIYEKKIGRPPKSRRKQPHEIQGKNGFTMSKHGIIIHCSWCHEPNHNCKGCPLKKAGIRPKQQVRRQPPPFATTTGEEEEGTEQQAVVEVMTEHLQPTVQPLIVQESMLSQMLSQVNNL